MAIASIAAAVAQLPGISSFDAGWRSLNRKFTHIRSQRLARSAVRQELESYTARQLSELGLTPGDIPDVAAGTYRAR